ncbi:hypothetical protein T265_03135 [Opisthorchis viverrini]|uniref:Uncharacterized protein n=1 Tax=Opisthorchis viverrini TaxID=6198 RepID=A0A074ZTF1_OPIVI|nr:hypothetical protein T265_03135 [Opisthorchis viverrini]KER30401.1 hypothetical protein T265_03135 [Opisthorchis viverrini]
MSPYAFETALLEAILEGGTMQNKSLPNRTTPGQFHDISDLLLSLIPSDTRGLFSVHPVEAGSISFL